MSLPRRQSGESDSPNDLGHASRVPSDTGSAQCDVAVIDGLTTTDIRMFL
jgi:hypothetical protein